jgi:hypothetical protein
VRLSPLADPPAIPPELEGALANFGAALPYGPGMIQSFLDAVTCFHPDSLGKLPFLAQPRGGFWLSDADELREIRSARAFLIPIIAARAFSPPPAAFPPVRAGGPGQSPGGMKAGLSSFFVSILTGVSGRSKSVVPDLLRAMKGAFGLGAPVGQWDVPAISDGLIAWLSEIGLSETLEADILSMLFSVWTSLISGRRRVSDFVALCRIHGFQRFSGDAKCESGSWADQMGSMQIPLLWDYFDNSKHGIIHELFVQHGNGDHPYERRIAVADGFLYILDSQIGLLKYGTGYGGTLYLAQAGENLNFKGQAPVSLGVSGGYVVLRTSKSNDLILIRTSDLSDMKHISGPTGFLTGFGSNLYFLEDRKLSIIDFSNGMFGRVLHQIDLESHAKWQAGHETTELATDGIHLLVYQQTETLKRFIFECSSGRLLGANSISGGMRLSIGLDAVFGYLVEVPFTGPIEFHGLHRSYGLHTEWSQICSGLRGIAECWGRVNSCCIEWLHQALPDSAFELNASDSRVLIDFALETRNSTQLTIFSDVCVFSLAILYYQFETLVLPTVDEFQAIVTICHLSRFVRIEFAKALLSHPDAGRSIFSEFKVCERFLLSVNPDDVLVIFGQSEFFRVPVFLYCVLYSDSGWAVLNRCVERPDLSLGFLSSVIRGFHYCITKQTMAAPAGLPILEILGRLSSLVHYEMLLPLCMSFLHSLAHCGVLWGLTLELVGVLIRFLQERVGKDALERYASAHAQERSRSTVNERTEIAESGHPYDHNLDIVKSWNFPGAREVRVTFDRRSATETNCDYLRIYRDLQRRDQDLIGYLTGRAGSSCWSTPIVVPSTQIVFYFHSDGSVNDWGYRATITATFANSLPFSSPPFAFDLMHELLNLFDCTPPACRDYEIPKSAVGNCECRESKCAKVQDRVSRFLPGLSSLETLPDSMIELFDLIGSENPRLDESDVAALAATPVRFLPLHSFTLQEAVHRLLSLYADARLPPPSSLQQLSIEMKSHVLIISDPPAPVNQRKSPLLIQPTFSQHRLSGHAKAPPAVRM